jgi:transposase
MAVPDILAFVRIDELTDKQRSALKARLLARQRQLKFATRAIDRALRELEKKPKRARRKAARRHR